MISLTSDIKYKICQCENNFDDNNNAEEGGTCRSKSDLGGRCLSNDNCDTSNAECKRQKCQCQYFFYDNNNAEIGGSCNSISRLKVKSVQVVEINSSLISVDWTNPLDNNAIERKRVHWKGTNVANQSKNVTNSKRSTIVEGLTPGGSYSIWVVSVDDDSRQIPQTVKSDEMLIITKPAKPGPILSIIPDVTGTQVTLTWGRSLGVVTKYVVSFKDTDVSFPRQIKNETTSNTITMTSLTPGRLYNISVTAVSGDIKSDSTFNTTKTALPTPLGGYCLSGQTCGINAKCVAKMCQCRDGFYDTNNARKGGVCKPNMTPIIGATKDGIKIICDTQATHQTTDEQHRIVVYKTDKLRQLCNTLMMRTSSPTTAVGVLSEQKLLFWSVPSECTIKRYIVLKDNFAKDIILFGAISVALDWIGFNMYWMDKSIGLRVSDINGKKTVLLQSMSNGKNVVVDSRQSYAFYSEHNLLFRIHMDGKERNNIDSCSIGHDYGPIALDFKELNVYSITDAKLVRFSYEGKSKITINNINGYVNGLAVDHNWLYRLSSNGTLAICNKNDNSECYDLITQGSAVNDIVLYDPSGHQKDTSIHPCRIEEQSVCQYLCLLSPVEPYFRCACPENFKLKSDNRSCVEEICFSDISKCDHECTDTDKHPFFKCSCHAGFNLQDDERSCNGGENVIYFADPHNRSIRQLYADSVVPNNTVGQQPLTVSKCIAKVVTVDPVEKQIIWMERNLLLGWNIGGLYSPKVIYQKRKTNEGAFQYSRLSSIAIDWLRRVIYIGKNDEGEILSSNLLTNKQQTLIKIKGPVDMSMDIFHSVLYSIMSSNGIGCLYTGDDDKSIQVIKHPGRTTDDRVINSLVVDAKEGMIYYLSELNTKSILFAIVADGTSPSRELINSNQNAVGITIAGNYLYWIGKSVTSSYKIMKLDKRENGYQPRPIFESQIQISGMAIGTFKRTNDAEICSDNVTTCLDKSGNKKCLSKEMLCDEIPDCYGEFDEFYCCNDTNVCGIENVFIEFIKSEEKNSPLVSLSDMQNHPFLKLIFSEFFATFRCKINADYKDKTGRRRKLIIHNLKETHILMQFLGPGLFRKVNFTKQMSLTGYLVTLKEKTFIFFHALESLSIKQTILKTISNNVFNGLIRLLNLDIKNNAVLRVLEGDVFDELISLVTLDISSNALRELQKGTFKNLKSLKEIDLTGNDLFVTSNYFQNNSNLGMIKADSYIFCCMRPSLRTENCKAPTLTGTGCNDLIEGNILKIFLWLIGTLAVFGNLAVIVYRFFGADKLKNETFNIFVINLSVSDAMMGIYMLIIGIQDAKFSGNYIKEESRWKNDHLCTISGIISLVSSESSVIFILLITIDRIFAVKYPISGPKFTRRSTYILTFFSWVFAFVTAIIPRLLYEKFYSYSGVCIALPLTVHYVDGKHYSVALFLGFNFVIFVLIAIGQFVIFREIHVAGKKVRSSISSKDRDVAKLLLMVVISDCFCWLPIGILIIMALCGVAIPKLMYTWLMVFVLPANSAFNPLLYKIIPEFKKIIRKRTQTKTRRNTATKNKFLRTTKEKHPDCKELQILESSRSRSTSLL